jgi:hypothetical protein
VIFVVLCGGEGENLAGITREVEVGAAIVTEQEEGKCGASGRCFGFSGCLLEGWRWLDDSLGLAVAVFASPVPEGGGVDAIEG